jgi:hypothetical protein
MRYYLCADKVDPNKNAWTPDIAAAQLFRTNKRPTIVDTRALSKAQPESSRAS